MHSIKLRSNVILPGGGQSGLFLRRHLDLAGSELVEDQIAVYVLKAVAPVEQAMGDRNLLEPGNNQLTDLFEVTTD